MKIGTSLLLGASVTALVLPGAAEHGRADAPHTRWSSVEFSMQPRDEATHPWIVRLKADGSGSYSEAGQNVEQPVTVGQATMQRIGRGEHRVKTGKCDTHEKNIANTGRKTIRYVEPDGASECTFNYSEDPELMNAAGAFVAIADTIQAGEQLQHDLRYDRLALDAEMDRLLEDVRTGGAIELGNIAPVLQSLVDDDHVIDRVRRKAARLLQTSGSTSRAPGSESRAR